MANGTVEQLTANDIAIPFYFICIVSNLAIILVWFSAPKLTRSFFNRLVVYQACADLLWSILSFIQGVDFSAAQDWSQNSRVCHFYGVIRYIKLFYTLWDGFVAVTMYQKIVRLRSTKQYEKIALATCFTWSVVTCVLVETIFPSGPSFPSCGPTGPNAQIATQVLFFANVYFVLLVILVCYGLTIRHVYKIWVTVGDKSEERVHSRAIRHLLFFPMISIIIWSPSIARRSYEGLHGYSFVGNIFQSIFQALSGPLNLVIWGFSRKIWRAYPCFDTSRSLEDDVDSSSKDRPPTPQTGNTELDFGVGDS